MKNTNSILIVGGGTAALIAGIILKKKLNIQVDIVHSSNIGIIGVGESSTEHWREFCTFVGINHVEALVACNATYKTGITFKGWGKKTWIHHVNPDFAKKWGQYSPIYAKQIAEDSSYLAPDFIRNNKLPKHLLNKPEVWPANQFNFDTYKLNEYLTSIAKSFGINFFDDEINEIFLDDQGNIKNLKGNKFIYEYDFYLDCTGFKRLLMNKLGCEWQSFSKYLKTNSAIVFQTPDTDNYEVTVTAQAMDYGWMFRIPTYGRYGNGYVFDNNHITPEQAKQEVESKYFKDIDVRKVITFDPGQVKEPWIKNCVAIGLSGSFIEPLEATSISTTIQQAFILMHHLPFYDDKSIKRYNTSFTDILENIRDFIIIHYLNKSEKTNFWKEYNQIKLPDSLQENLDIWKHRLPIAEDFAHLSSYVLFHADNFTLALNGVDHFDKESIRKEYTAQNPYIQAESEKQLDYLKYQDGNTVCINHKDFVSLTRGVFNVN